MRGRIALPITSGKIPAGSALFCEALGVRTRRRVALKSALSMFKVRY
jgi:hypothetical protein